MTPSVQISQKYNASRSALWRNELGHLPPAPTLVELAEATVAIPFRMHLPVFFPSQLQRQMAVLLQLRMQSGKIREDLFGESLYHLPLSEQCLLNALLVPLLSERPHHTGCGGPVEVFMNGALANRTSTGSTDRDRPGTSDRHHAGIVIAINPEPVIGMPGTLIGIVRSPQQPLLQKISSSP